MLFPIVTGVLLALRVPFGAIAAVLMLLGAQWYVLFNVLAGASAIPHDLDEAADVYAMKGARPLADAVRPRGASRSSSRASSRPREARGTPRSSPRR